MLLRAWNGWLAGATNSAIAAKDLDDHATAQQHTHHHSRRKRRRGDEDAARLTRMQRWRQYAASRTIDAHVGVLVFASAVASGLQNACDSWLGQSLACSDTDQTRWLRFHAGLEGIALGCALAFALEAAFKVLALGPRVYLSSGLNCLDLGITAVSLFEVDSVLRTIRCMLRATNELECEDGASGLLLFRSFRLVPHSLTRILKPATRNQKPEILKSEHEILDIPNTTA